jgi:hypothetical protein
MASLTSLKREMAIISRALTISKPKKTIHKIVYVDPETGELVPNCPPFYCYTGFTNKEIEELKKQHDNVSIS